MGTQFSVSLNLVKAEISNALDQAASHLDAYSEQADAESLRSFLEEIQQIRGTFKMLDFRAGERLCEELAETGRSVRSQGVSEPILNAFTQAVVFLKRYVDKKRGRTRIHKSQKALRNGRMRKWQRNNQAEK